MPDPTTATVTPRLVIVMDYPRVCGSGGASVLTGWDHDTEIEFPNPHDKAFRFIAVYGEGIYEITHAEARRCLQAWEMGDEDGPVAPAPKYHSGHRSLKRAKEIARMQPMAEILDRLQRIERMIRDDNDERPPGP